MLTIPGVEPRGNRQPSEALPLLPIPTRSNNFNSTKSTQATEPTPSLGHNPTTNNVKYIDLDDNQKQFFDLAINKLNILIKWYKTNRNKETINNLDNIDSKFLKRLQKIKTNYRNNLTSDKILNEQTVKNSLRNYVSKLKNNNNNNTYINENIKNYKNNMLDKETVKLIREFLYLVHPDIQNNKIEYIFKHNGKQIEIGEEFYGENNEKNNSGVYKNFN